MAKKLTQLPQPDEKQAGVMQYDRRLRHELKNVRRLRFMAKKLTNRAKQYVRRRRSTKLLLQLPQVLLLAGFTQRAKKNERRLRIKLKKFTKRAKQKLRSLGAMAKKFTKRAKQKLRRLRAMAKKFTKPMGKVEFPDRLLRKLNQLPQLEYAARANDGAKQTERRLRQRRKKFTNRAKKNERRLCAMLKKLSCTREKKNVRRLREVKKLFTYERLRRTGICTKKRLRACDKY